MSKSDKLYIARYNDYYGKLLTEHQCDMIKLYYDCDISLFEIAEQFGVSRQAVRDSIKRAEQLLTKYENILQLHEKNLKLHTCISAIESKLSGEQLNAIQSELKSLDVLMEGNNGDI